jgi:hypothetical protein
MWVWNLQISCYTVRVDKCTFALSARFGFGLAEKLNVNVFVNLDKILIASESEEQNMEFINWVIETLTHHGLRGKMEKCVFGVELVEFLGYELTLEGILVLQSRLLTLHQMDTPKNL